MNDIQRNLNYYLMIKNTSILHSLQMQEKLKIDIFSVKNCDFFVVKIVIFFREIPSKLWFRRSTNLWNWKQKLTIFLLRKCQIEKIVKLKKNRKIGKKIIKRLWLTNKDWCITIRKTLTVDRSQVWLIYAQSPPPTSFGGSRVHTVFENRPKSRIQHCERSELRLHFEWTKVN